MKTRIQKIFLCLLTLSFLTTTFWTPVAEAQWYRGRQKIEEEDGSPTGRPAKIKVTNDSLTDNGDGTFSLSTAAPPGGSDTQVQFNDGNVFAGDASFTYNKTTAIIGIVGGIDSEGRIIIDATGTEVFLIRKDADGGDIFAVNTTNGVVSFGGVAPVTGTRITLPMEDDAVTPTFAFGDGGEGFYQNVDGRISVALNGIKEVEFNAVGIDAEDAGGPRFLNQAASSSVPTLIPNRGDVNTGIGSAGDDSLALIAGAVKMMELTEAVSDYCMTRVSTAYLPSADQARANDSTITIDNTIVRVVGDGAAALLDVAPAIEDGAVDGQMIIIQGTSDANTVAIADNVNTQLPGGTTITLGIGDIAGFIWDSGDSDWYLLYTSNN